MKKVFPAFLVFAVCAAFASAQGQGDSFVVVRPGYAAPVYVAPRTVQSGIVYYMVQTPAPVVLQSARPVVVQGAPSIVVQNTAAAVVMRGAAASVPVIVQNPSQVVVPVILGQQPATGPSPKAEQSRLIARYLLSVVSHYSVGNVRLPPLATVDSAQCSVYSDGTLALRVVFNDGAYTDYRISNPVFKIRENDKLFRTVYTNIEKTGADMLLGPSSCDVYSSGYEIYSIVIHGMNNTSITINLKSPDVIDVLPVKSR